MKRNTLSMIGKAILKMLLCLLFIGSLSIAANYGFIWIIALSVVIFVGYMLSMIDWRKLWNNWKR
jgi:O-antigen/teichoic acid export membrane protein